MSSYNTARDRNTRIGRTISLRKPGQELLIASVVDGGEAVVNNDYEMPLSSLLRAFLSHVNLAEVSVVVSDGHEIIGKSHLEPEVPNVRQLVDLLILSGHLSAADSVLGNLDRPETYRESEIMAALECIRRIRDSLEDKIQKGLSTTLTKER